MREAEENSKENKAGWGGERRGAFQKEAGSQAREAERGWGGRQRGGAKVGGSRCPAAAVSSGDKCCPHCPPGPQQATSAHLGPGG